jgi:preprotein translocase subunit Sss1
MPTITDEAAQDAQRPLWQRLIWFAALWAGSVAALGIVGYAIRLVLKP